jgi:hypothetical protein
MAFTFLLITDFDQRITAAERNAITNSDDAMLEIVESEVIEEFAALTNGRYNMDAEFAKTGSERSNLLIRYLVDVVIYETICRNKPRQLPQFRVDRAEDARDFMVAAGKPRSNISPAWTLVAEPNSTSTGGSHRVGSWGSQEKLDLNY